MAVASSLTAVIAALFVLMSIRKRQHLASLREREERFRAVAQNLPGAVFVYDMSPEGLRTPVYVGPGFEKLIGSGPAKRLATGLNDVFFELLHPDDLDALKRTGVFEPDHVEPVDMEYRFRTDGGGYRWVRSVAHPIRLEDGTLRWHGVLVDITDRKTAEDAFRRESVFRETVIQSCVEGLCVCHDIPQHPYVAFTVWNQRMTEITGYTMEQINRLGWYQTLYPDPDLQEKAKNRMQRMRQGDDLIAEEWEITRADGKKRVFEISTTVLRSAEGSTHALALMQDITERKQAQETIVRTTTMLNNILTSSTEYAIAATDLDLRVIHYNPAAERMFGLPINRVMGRRVVSIHEDLGVDPARVREALENIARDGKWETELKRSGLDGKERIIHPVVTTMYDESASRIGYVLLACDVTEQRQAEEARTKLESQLRHIHKLKAVEQLAAGVAHDFNSILTVVQGNAELLRSECRRRKLQDPELKIRDALEEIGNSVERGHKVVQNLLTFGRERSWRAQPIDLNEHVEYVCQMLKRIFESDIQINVLKEQNLRAIYADAGKIERALMNLLLNARDAMPHGGKLTIETANVDLDDVYVATHAEATVGPHVVVSVSDTGVGMDAPTRERVFEPFFTTKPVGEGSGLGLSIVHSVVKHADGHITLVSDVGKGTTFRLCFPATAA